MAILVPIYIGLFHFGLEAERLQAFASFPLVAFFYVFGQFAIYRARRYRLTRTVWRGVRFWMSGSGWAYALRASLWGLAMIFTLGLSLPWREAALERYKMRHSYYGDLQGSFEGRGWEFFKRGWWLWLLTPIRARCICSGVALRLCRCSRRCEWRWWLYGIRFGGVRLESTLRTQRADRPVLESDRLGSDCCSCCAFGLSSPCVGADRQRDGDADREAVRKPGSCTRAFRSSSLAGDRLSGLGAGAECLDAALSACATCGQRAVTSITVHGIEAAANVAAKGELANALGEGFADGSMSAGSERMSDAWMDIAPDRSATRLPPAACAGHVYFDGTSSRRRDGRRCGFADALEIVDG